MRHRSLLTLTIAVTAGSLTLSACGSRDDDSGEADAGKTTTVLIGLDAPLTGDLSALGQGIQNSADLAVKTANKNKEVKGVKFKLVPRDDVAQPATGQQNATQFVGNKDMIAAVGPLNSNVGESMNPVFGSANMLQISPANTNPALSQGEGWKENDKERPFKTYFRTSTTDAIQGPYAAQYVYNEEKFRKVYMIDDKKTYGAGLAETFKEEFTKLGGKVVGTEHVNPDDKDFASIATKVANSDADFVYYGGEYPAGAPLASQIKKAGGDIPTVGGDALFSAEYIKLNKSAEGDIASSVGAPLETLDTAKDFIANYKEAGYKDAYEAYGGYSYDSTWAIIQAVKTVVEANDGKLPGAEVKDARADVVEAAQNVSFDGVTGKVAFDEFGDTTNKQLSLYEVKDGEHAPIASGEFQG